MSSNTNEVKYVHLRKNYLYNDQALAGVPGHRRAAKGGATLAYKVNEDGTVSVGIAKCSDDDHYIKSAGRGLAASRLGQFTFPKGFDVRSLEGRLSSFLVDAV